MSHPTLDDHITFLKQSLDLARLSPPKPTNFRVGALLVSYPPNAAIRVLSTGYTLELPGNTHAEQCALSDLATENKITESQLHTVLTRESNTVLYTSLEPCSLRLSGNTPCVQRIIATRKTDPLGGIRRVIFGAKEPGTFVKDSKSCQLLDEAGIEWEYIPEFEQEILEIAMEGHVKKNENLGGGERQIQTEEQKGEKGPNIDYISVEERGRQEAIPRNPKKRMMEADVSGR